MARGMAGEDFFARVAAGSRDNARSPMQWDGSAHAGFTTGVPWFPVNPNATEINAAAALADEDSVLHHYRKLIALRHDHPVVAAGDFTMLLEQDPRIYAFTRSLHGVTLLVLGNFSGDEAPVGLPDAAAWATSELLLGNYPTVEEWASGIVLRPWEARIYRRG
jgi:oligo-1,6-glucosidase